jgi:hypothetical protein
MLVSDLYKNVTVPDSGTAIVQKVQQSKKNAHQAETEKHMLENTIAKCVMHIEKKN